MRIERIFVFVVYFRRMPSIRKKITDAEILEGITNKNRVALSRAITLIESSLPGDRMVSEKILNQLLPKTGSSLRIGITGVPGVGKSTFIESFGLHLCQQGLKVAVLAVDPSSQKSAGSIMGDKTRMEQLAHHPDAYIRPSPTGTSLGGVTSKTRETILLCEAAGFDIILVETVGVGQSEVSVKGMVDFFLLLMLAGAGDELQGIKKGIMEMADGIAITKSDGDNVKKSESARIEYQNALHLFPPSESGWYPKVLTCSALEGNGLEEIWLMIQQFEKVMKESGQFMIQRNSQNVNWMHESIQQGLLDRFFRDKKTKELVDMLTRKVINGNITPQAAAQQVLSTYSNSAK